MGREDIGATIGEGVGDGAYYTRKRISIGIGPEETNSMGIGARYYRNIGRKDGNLLCLYRKGRRNLSFYIWMGNCFMCYFFFEKKQNTI